MKYSSLKKALLRKQRNIKRLRKIKNFTSLYPILSTVTILIFVIIFISSLVWLFANLEWFELKSKNELGDAFGGLSNPIIAFIGVVVTFMAFYIQYQFNREQSKLIAAQRREREEDKKERDIEIKKEAFDKKFYELLRIHNENVNNISVNGINKSINGRKCFDYFVEELHVIIHIIKENEPNLITEQIVKKSYNHFFYGSDDASYLYNKDDISQSLRYLSIVSESDQIKFQKYIVDLDLPFEELNYPRLDYFFCKGYSSDLSLYYRFLFMMVKNVVEQDEEYLSYIEKRQYLKILRTQLSNNEQILLFYNWYSDIGSDWENDHNKFFTDFRMIHNIRNYKLYKEIHLKEIFSSTLNEIKILNDKDYLFEDDEFWDIEVND